MITVNSYLASPESFAPYSYACKYSLNLHKRYAEQAEILDLHDDLDTPAFGGLNIHICERRHSKKRVNVTDVISKRGCKTLQENGHFEYNSLRTFMESHELLNSTCMSLVVINGGSEYFEEIAEVKGKYCNVLLIIISDENSGEQVVPKAIGNILVKPGASVNDAIGDELERIFLKSLKTKCENVAKWLNEKKYLALDKSAKVASRKRKSFIEACCKLKRIYNPALPTIDKENDCSFDFTSVSIGINGHVYKEIKDVTLQMNNKKEVCSLTGVEEYAKRKGPVNTSVPYPISDKLQGVDRDALESLLAEMIALYNNSRVPDDERPNVSQYVEKEISEKLRTELLAISSVKGFGYRFTCFVVYVGEGKESEHQQQKIRSVLEDNEILDYEIQSVSELKHFVRVGNRIRATRRCQGRDRPVEGTLGCFAKNKDAEDKFTYALISKHVASACDSFYISCSASEIQGEVMSSSVTETGLDIAALRLILNDKNIDVCAKFKTEPTDGDFAVAGEVCDLLNGKLHIYCDHAEHGQSDMVCNGQNVYIWGAMSKPGKGVITMRAFKCGDMKALIQIEDRVPSKKGEVPERFCCPGDSGAIVCAEDSRGQFVHVIAMLIGMINEGDIQKDQTVRGKYLSVPLSSGLHELDERMGYALKIFECID